MKILSLIIFMFVTNVVHATVDIQGQATIVVENYNSGEYFLQTVPTDYCVGIDSLTLAAAITQPVMIKSNYGCGNAGSMIQDTQVNAATCATIVAKEVSNVDGSYNARTVSIEKDLSGCGAKASDSKFVKALDNAIYNTYNASGYQVVSLK